MTVDLKTNGVNGHSKRILRVGIIGCGEITQVSHIPTLGFSSDKFAIKYLCDISENALAHCAAKISPPPKTTKHADELCASDEVDVVVIANADPFHVPHALLSLQYNKYCLLEKPAALNYRDIDALVAAEATSQGKVFVGYMRRYAPAFLEAIQEVGGLDNVHYARVRDIIGPNSAFVDQSGTFPKKFNDFAQSDVDELKKREADMVQQALNAEFGVEVTPASQMMLRILGGLGSHDLSAMREILGMPKSCIGASLGPPRFWSALLQYDNFSVIYESGINEIPLFDASIEVFSLNKTVKVSYDTPYVKGLPTTLTIREKVEGRSGSDSSGYQEKVIRRTYEDPYSLEFDAFYETVVENKTPKTTVADARNDLDVFAMIMRAGEHNYHSL
ncbi:hypothetical protein C7974DRAFT_370719 [Boeremia exigua]|uniref:uncharacterized protein n=1 Tax=Boeremia exigua TaxID=749465 RepID=UPI001E8E9E2A|nr:uncharacterized protein C7974DRAFT_370719 [Boeremia exigua]KAH6611693.1 hypothetical protein C7974DRAFT_370719 [Boeremia exigua]